MILDVTKNKQNHIDWFIYLYKLQSFPLRLAVIFGLFVNL